MVPGRARGGAVAERSDVVRHEFFPAQAGRVEPAAPLQPAMEGVHVGVRSALAIGRFRRLAVWPAIPVHLGVEPVADVDERLGERITLPRP